MALQLTSIVNESSDPILTQLMRNITSVAVGGTPGGGPYTTPRNHADSFKIYMPQSNTSFVFVIYRDGDELVVTDYVNGGSGRIQIRGPNGSFKVYVQSSSILIEDVSAPQVLSSTTGVMARFHEFVSTPRSGPTSSPGAMTVSSRHAK